MASAEEAIRSVVLDDFLSVPYAEYVHLVRTRDGWKIANAMWQWR